MTRRFIDLVEACRPQVAELFPWDLREELEAGKPLLLIDIREPYEFSAMHIAGSINVPRGILETACEYDYEETVPELAAARDRDVVLLCRSGNRTLLAGAVLQQMGFRNVRSLRTGLRGWSEFEQPLVAPDGCPVTQDEADAYFEARIRPDQRRPAA